MNFRKGQYQETFLNSLLALLAAGIFVAYNFTLPLIFIYSTIFISLVAAILLLRRENNFTFVPFCILFFMLGVLRYQVVDTLPANDISNFAGSEMKVTGTIRENPRVRLNADGSYSVRYTIDVESIRYIVNDKSIGIKAKNEKASGGLTITVIYQNRKSIPTVLIGYKISAFGYVKKPTNYNNPGQLDIITMLKNDGISARLSAGRVLLDIEEVEGSLWTKFLRLMAAVREHYKESMQQVMSNEDASAIFAMLFGGYEGLKPELTESFVTTGIVHILSVSGSHMSLLAATTAWLCNFFGLRRSLKLFIGLFVIFSYSVLSGFLFPVIRSAFMGFLVFFAAASDYKSDSRRSLTIIAILLLLYSPLSLFHISFQLSFLATAGIIYWAPMISRYLKKFKTPSFIAMSFSCSISAIIFCQPIIAWYFNQLSVSSLLSNLLVIPIIEFVIVLGLLAGIVGLILPFIAKFVFLFDSLIFSAAYELNKLIAKLPASNVYFPTLNFAWSFFYYLILLLIIHKESYKKIISVAAFGLLMFFSFHIAVNFSKSPEVQLHFIDVHQGDAALLITPHGHAMMFDTGGVREHTYDIGARVDVPYLHHYGITHLDYIFLTHCHEDHTAGAGSIVKQIEVDNIITANEPKSDYAASMAISEHSDELKVLRPASEGEVFDVDGVKVEVLFAPPFTNASTGNEVSNVYKISFGNFSALFTGDLVKENEAVILQKDLDLSSTVLKVGHHGSKTSSSKEFVEKVHPLYAVFCVGANNTFGHPRPEVVQLMEEVGAKIYRTDKNGAIVFISDGKTIKVNTKL